MLREFLRQTRIPAQTTWYFVMQNCSDAFANEILELCRNRVDVVLARFPSNLGLSKAMSCAIKLAAHAEFVLNIEDDWVLLDTHVPNDEWLQTCLTTMHTTPDLSTIFLRAYNTDLEKWQYGWTRTIPYRCHKHTDNFNFASKVAPMPRVSEQKGCSFRRIPDFLFTFNPCLVRNADYHKTAYPLPVFAQDQKAETHSADWGNCEALTMEKTRHLLTFWLNEGVFGHYEDWFPFTK